MASELTPALENSAESESQIGYVEGVLVLVAVGLAFLLAKMPASRLLVLNLFFLPVVLAGFFLGRYRSGALALLSVLATSCIVTLTLGRMVVYSSPLIIGLELMIWGATLGLTAILVGTLSDENSERMKELTEAHVGVVEVLIRYLQGVNPDLKARSYRVAELAQKVASEMRLPASEIEDIRVAALLTEMEHVEVTTRVIRKAVGGLSSQSPELAGHTFHGSDLIGSLGQVLSGAFPLVDAVRSSNAVLTAESADSNKPVGTRIIEVIRSFVDLTSGEAGFAISREDALAQMKNASESELHPAAVHALESIIQRERRNERVLDTVCIEEPEPVAD